MFYVAARKDTQVELEKGSNSLNFTNPTHRDAFRAALCNNYGIVDSNLSLFYMAESNDNVARIRNGDTYALVWTDGEVTGFDFSDEDAKNILKFDVKDENNETNDTLTANGTDYLTIYAYVFLPDLSELDTSFNKTILIPIIDPSGKNCFIKTTFVNGAASKVFKTTNYGIWKIPNGYRFADVPLKISNEMIYDINATLDI